MEDSVITKDRTPEANKPVIDDSPSNITPSMEVVPTKPSIGPVKEDLIATAVSFLQNAKVNMRPKEEIINFLRKKGLSDFEISTALLKVENAMPKIIESNIPTAYNGFAPPLVPPRQPTSAWSMVKSTMNVLVVVSSAAYGCHLLYQWVLRTYLKGGTTDQLKRIMEIQENMQTVMEKLTVTLNRMQIESANQSRLLEEFLKSHSRASVGEKDDLLAELARIKSLLLNKRAFPAAPATGMILPQWQKLKVRPVEDSDPEQHFDHVNGMEYLGPTTDSSDTEYHVNSVVDASLKSIGDTDEYHFSHVNGVDECDLSRKMDSELVPDTSTDTFDDLRSTVVEGSCSEEERMQLSMKMSTDESLTDVMNSQ